MRLINSDHLLGFHVGYQSDNHLSNHCRPNHNCEVDPEVFLLSFRINSQRIVCTPLEIVIALIDLILGPLIVLIEVAAEVEVVSIGSFDREMIPVDRSILDQLTYHIHRNVGTYDDQIHIKMLV